jgi:hypothetical protein
MFLVLVFPLATGLHVSAADIDKYLPNDTEAVRCYNIRRLLDSEIIKKHLLGKVENFLKNSEEIQKELKAIGFDPLKDLDSYIEATPGGGKVADGLFMLHGKFDQAKINARLAKMAADTPALLKTTKVGDDTLWELALPFQPLPGVNSVWFAVVDETTLAAAANKDYMLEVFDKKAGKKKTALRKEMKDVLAKVDGRETLWIAASAGALLKGPLRELPDLQEFVAILDKSNQLYGGLTITEEVKGSGTLVCKDAATAGEALKLIEKGLAEARKNLPTDPQAKAIVETLLGGIKVSVKENTVTAQLNVSKRDVAKALESEK